MTRIPQGFTPHRPVRRHRDVAANLHSVHRAFFPLLSFPWVIYLFWGGATHTHIRSPLSSPPRSRGKVWRCSSRGGRKTLYRIEGRADAWFEKGIHEHHVSRVCEPDRGSWMRRCEAISGWAYVDIPGRLSVVGVLSVRSW